MRDKSTSLDVLLLAGDEVNVCARIIDRVSQSSFNWLEHDLSRSRSITPVDVENSDESKVGVCVHDATTVCLEITCDANLLRHVSGLNAKQVLVDGDKILHLEDLER